MIGRMAATVVFAAFLCATAFVAASVSAHAQSAALTASPASGPAPLSVTFTAPMRSYDGAIDFGDGSAAAQLRPSSACAGCGAVTHVYQSNGKYEARLSAGSDVVARATIAVGQ